MERSQLELAGTFADVARSLLAETEQEVILRRIVGFAVSVLEPCEHAGIDLVVKRRIQPVAPSSEVAAQLAELQNEVDEGPCLSAIREHEVFSAEDLANEHRWPRFAARAHAETGITSILGFRLYAEEDTMGALNLYSSKAHAFDDEATAIGSALAAHAAIAMATARQRDYMADAIDSRDVIGQAKGILMARHGIGADEAFERIRSASQRDNVKVLSVAQQTIASATSPGAV